jgi:nicotinamidase-related amidase
MHQQLRLKQRDDEQTVRDRRKQRGKSGRGARPLDLAQAALLVIDMQRYFLDEGSCAFLPPGRAIIPNVRRLLRYFREHQRPVIFTCFAVRRGETDPIGRWWGRTVRAGSAAAHIVQELRPKAGERVLRKTSYSAFHETDLEADLKRQHVGALVVAGVLSNRCCESTAREAFARGFDVFFLADATATFTESMHAATLLNIACGYGTLLGTAECCAIASHDR